MDSNDHVLRELDEAGFHAINAVGLQVAKRHSCMIAKEKGRPEPIGSGTFVRLGSCLFVATAKHLFEGLRADELIGIYWGEEDNRASVTHRNIILDEKLDLAAISLSPDTKACGVSLGLRQLNHPQAEPALFVVSGIPVEKCKIDPNLRTLVVGHFSLGLVSLPPQSWPTNSQLAISPDVDLLLNYTENLAIDGRGAPMRQIDPRGLSGGGIWSVPSLTESIWSPDSARLIAIQSSVESGRWRYLRATRIGYWIQLADKRSDQSV
jgi:hypothetical protein